MRDLLATLLDAADTGDGARAPAVDALEAAAFDIETVGGTRAVVATRGEPRLAFCGHLDVVPRGDGWRHAPGDVAEERVWGRGACDMLGSVACWLHLAATTDLPFAVVLTTDEETGMQDADALVASGVLDAFDALVVGEPTDLEVGIAEKGVYWLRFTVQGRSAHASMPQEGVNAVVNAARAILRLTDLQLPGKSDLLGSPTISIDRVHGGTATNVVPESATFEVDVRYLPGVDAQEVFDLVDVTVHRAVDLHHVEVLSHHPPFATPPDAALVAAARDAVAAAGREPRTIGLPYGTEASRYQNLDADVVILGPGEPKLAHTNQESIRLTDLDAGTRAYRALAEAYR